ncbi:EscU/YscU/HrcU family type III secretion system export apparatus switch protein [Nocardioides sp. SOB77]|uniref:EscU/YscU/HrcU family type III secretion system export apparatus switch protein n=1 Tax=Nocardioides oceani TaxID=3058369 RepID=A0ABT8FFT9_9ACTN|nr:EscU/YscU/HrcU family type III secretion system export apparatus switch protein [Nocardioides oceani]MDN4173543.1 EscU/YscU/HrcU family type III secretion system export apparatus switch protein [Nocardioides oceani]
MSDDKTEKPTPKRRKEARKEGQVARTQELGAWSALLLVSLALPALLRHELESLSALLERCLASAEGADVPMALELLAEAGGHILLTLVVLGCCVMVVGVAGALAQGGFFVATKTVTPNLKKLDPLKGFKRIFGPQAWWEGAKMLVKCALVAGLVWLGVDAMLPILGGFVPVGVVLDAVGGEALTMLRNVAVAGLVMAAVDYAVQRRRIGKQTRMSKDEVKREHKQSEGDPLVKSAIRSRQLAASRNRMLADVPTADVVLVNPTHVAVALRYDESSPAPRVVARGAGLVAQRIREAAVAHDVPLVRDVPLARALYAAGDVGREIPVELFAAVAQVLAFVISRRSRGQRGGEHRTPRPTDDVPAVARRRRPAGGRPPNPSAPPLPGR